MKLALKDISWRVVLRGVFLIYLISILGVVPYVILIVGVQEFSDFEISDGLIKIVGFVYGSFLIFYGFCRAWRLMQTSKLQHLVCMAFAMCLVSATGFIFPGMLFVEWLYSLLSIYIAMSAAYFLMPKLSEKN